MCQGGFGPDGINMKPLWVQKRKDDGMEVTERALTKWEKRASAQTKFELTKEYEFDRVLKAPNLFQKGFGDEREQHEDDPAKDDDGLLVGGVTRTSKSLSAVMQKLRVPASSWPGLKVNSFHQWIADIST